MTEVRFELGAEEQLASLKERYADHVRIFEQTLESIKRRPEQFPGHSSGIRIAGNHAGNGVPRTRWYFFVENGQAVVFDIVEG